MWAAVLYAGPGAMLSHQTAAELWKLTDTPSSLIHVTVPGDRRVRRRAGIAIHMSARASAAVHPSRNLPRTRLEETVIDLWESAQNLDNAVSWVTSALGRRLTTQDKLRDAMAARSRVQRRKLLAELLSPDAAGIHSVLEYRYVRHVERPHGLSGATKQASARRNGRNEYRDQLYAEYGTAIELDGRLAHPGDTRWNDIRRDNAAAAIGITTLGTAGRSHNDSLPRRGRDCRGAPDQGIHRRAAMLSWLSRRLLDCRTDRRSRRGHLCRAAATCTVAARARTPGTCAPLANGTLRRRGRASDGTPLTAHPARSCRGL